MVTALPPTTRRTLAVVFSLILLGSLHVIEAARQPRSVLPPTRVTLAPPASDVTEITFTLRDPIECPCDLLVTNGDDDGRHRATAWVSVDDMLAIAPPALTPARAAAAVVLSLSPGPHIARVRLAGPAGAFVTVSITGHIPVDDLLSPRANHTATLLGDGSVRVAAGSDGVRVLASSERIDPRSRQVSAAPDLQLARASASAAVLPTGELFIAGGTTDGGATAATEIAGGSAEALALALTAPRAEHMSTVLPDGRIWIAGGQDAAGSPLASVEVIDPRPDPFGGDRYDVRHPPSPRWATCWATRAPATRQRCCRTDRCW
jgi:hypothetical protein